MRETYFLDNHRFFNVNTGIERRFCVFARNFRRLVILEKETIEVMIVDQKMPDVSGIDFIKKIKLSYPDIIFILITAYASLHDALQAINEANIFRFISKPWNDKQIINTINEAIEVYSIKNENKTLLAELKQKNEKLENAYKKVENSSKLKTAFLANMSHEIRTPLNAIVGFSNLLTTAKLTKEKQTEFSKIITNNSNGLLRIIDQIVEVAKIETGHITTYPKSHLVRNILDEVSFDFVNQANDNIEFNIDIPEELKDLKLNIDVRHLNRIFYNLLQNAFKFTNDGYVKFGVSLESEESLLKKNIAPQKDIFKETNKKLFFFVEDTGIGIHSQHQNEIFDLFRKLSDDSADIISGIGLGLYHSKKLVDYMNGEIIVSSEPNKGTKFYFYCDI